MQIIQAEAGEEITIPGVDEKRTMKEGEALAHGNKIWVTPTMYQALQRHPEVQKKRQYAAHDAPLHWL